MAAASRDFLVTEGSEPETFAEDVRFDVEGVFGAGFEEAKEVLDDGGGGVVAVKVDEAFAVGGWGVDEGGLLGVVDEVTGVNAWWFVSFWKGDCWSTLLTDEWNATVVYSCCFHFEPQVMEVLQRLNKRFQLCHDQHLGCGNQSPCLLEA